LERRDKHDDDHHDDRLSQDQRVTAKMPDRAKGLLMRAVAAVRRDDGISATEFALISLALLPILACVTDFSRYLWAQCEVAQSVHAATVYATANPTDYSGISSTGQSSTSLGGSSAYSITSNQCACGQPLGTTETTDNYTTYTTAFGSCSAVVPSCGTTDRIFLQIKANYSFSPIFGTLLPIPSVTTANVILRTQ
jgi:Flp pilus assembly protein TadG